MAIGGLRELLVIEAPVATPDEMGGSEVTWTEHTQVWAKVEEASARQVLWAQQNELRITHTVTVRKRDAGALTQAMRIRWGDRILQIHGPRGLGKLTDYVEISAEEGGGS